MNNTNQPAGHLAQLQFTETPFLIAVQEPDSFSACAKKLSEQHLFIKLGMIGLLCLLSGSFFLPTQYQKFCTQNPASKLCQIPLVNQSSVTKSGPELHANAQAAQRTLAPAESLIITLSAMLESAPVESPKPALPLPTPTLARPAAPQNFPASNFPMPEITEGAHSPFALQIGAFYRRTEAETRSAQLKRKGEKVRIVKAEVPGKGVWYRVQMGNFTECAAAIQYGQQLQAGKKLAEFIITDYQNPGQ